MKEVAKINIKAHINSNEKHPPNIVENESPPLCLKVAVAANKSKL